MVFSGGIDEKQETTFRDEKAPKETRKLPSLTASHSEESNTAFSHTLPPAPPTELRHYIYTTSRGVSFTKYQTRVVTGSDVCNRKSYQFVHPLCAIYGTRSHSVSAVTL